LSVIPSEGPEPSHTHAPAQKGVSASHIAGGGVVGGVGAVVVAVCNHFGWHVSDVDAVLAGGAAVSVGAGIGHVIGQVGIVGAFKQLWRGRKA
jgi:hypothetical protein